RWRRGPPPGRTPPVLPGWARSPEPPEGTPHLLAVVEMALHGADDLVVLVPLAGHQDEIARARVADGERDRRAPVWFDDVAGHARGTHALLDVREDAQRILGARVVGGEDDEVAPPRGGLAHEGPLAPVAVAAAAEDRDQPPARERTEHVERTRERVGRVCVVDHHGEARPGDLLEPPGRRLRGREAARDRRRRRPERPGCGRGSQDVLQVRRAHEPALDRQALGALSAPAAGPP